MTILGKYDSPCPWCSQPMMGRPIRLFKDPKDDSATWVHSWCWALLEAKTARDRTISGRRTFRPPGLRRKKR